MSTVIEYAKELIKRESITPRDCGCQDFIAEKLAALGFNNEKMRFGEVENLWSRRKAGKHLLVFAGHTDVVPPGPLENWNSDPFIPTVKDGLMYGRGSCDMKSSIAAMLVACENFLRRANPGFDIAFLITSDEEGPAKNGTVKVVEALERRGVKINWALVGEPSSREIVGDTIKNGRRGSLNGVLTVNGVQGHVAYPDTVVNPIHRASAALMQLCAMSWDEGNEFFPPTSFQISNIHGGSGAENMTPAALEIMFNFRFSTENTAGTLQKKVQEILAGFELDYRIDWRLSGNPFLTAGGVLVDAAKKAIADVNGIKPELSTGGGTSDGRFIARDGVEVLELGPVNKSIHQANEYIDPAQLEDLAVIYEKILDYLNEHVDDCKIKQAPG